MRCIHGLNEYNINYISVSQSCLFIKNKNHFRTSLHTHTNAFPSFIYYNVCHQMPPNGSFVRCSSLLGTEHRHSLTLSFWLLQMKQWWCPTGGTVGMFYLQGEPDLSVVSQPAGREGSDQQQIVLQRFFSATHFCTLNFA